MEPKLPLQVAPVGNLANLQLQVTSFLRYPGSGTNATIAGVVYIVPVTENGKIIHHKLTWKLTGTDDACAKGGGNVCGIHLHTGRDCSNATTIGGHLHNASIADPWTTVRYDSSAGSSTETTGSMVATGLSTSDLLGRALVVHNSVGAGERIACGIALVVPAVPPQERLIVKKWVKYPGSTWNQTVSGTVTIMHKAAVLDTLAVSWALLGTDDACPTGAGNVCGIHIHSGTTCDTAVAVGGHYYDKATLSKDPWTDVRYTSTNGKALSSDFSMEVLAGLDRSAIVGRAVVVHNSRGAGERIACGIIEEAASITTSFRTTRAGLMSLAQGQIPLSGLLMLLGMLLLGA